MIQSTLILIYFKEDLCVMFYYHIQSKGNFDEIHDTQCMAISWMQFQKHFVIASTNCLEMKE